MLSRLLPIAVIVVALVSVPAPAAPPEAAPPPHTPLPPGIDPTLADWTPRPATGKAEPWEKATDKDWIDARFRTMNTGPALNCTMRYPLGKEQSMVYKATVVKLGEKGDAGVVFDRSTMRLTAAWTGGYLNHSDRRFGLLNTPTPKGDMVFSLPTIAGWSEKDADFALSVKPTAPLPRTQMQYLGAYRHEDRVILSYRAYGVEILLSPSLASEKGVNVVAATYEIGPTEKELYTPLFFNADFFPSGNTKSGIRSTHDSEGKNWWGECAVGDIRRLEERVSSILGSGQSTFFAKFKPSPISRRTTFLYAHAHAPDSTAEAVGKHITTFEKIRDNFRQPALTKLTKGGPKRWGEPIVTKLLRGDDSGPFAIDTLTIPYKNPHGALFFCTGLDFLPDGRIAMCTCHGDVWLVTVDEKAGTCSWQRYATGLYHALGLKVIGGKVVVIERGQLTRLHDLNNDGEADFYECISNNWDTGSGEHSYDTCLETDPQGNFYFFKTGDTDTPTGGSLIRVSKDGSKSEIFCTGFRHPIGMGMSPSGILTGADQEGNWMPATRIDEYKQGGFYGDMRAHHRKEPPKTYDPPLCWLPREVDNSAGGQTWVPEKTFGPLAGLPLHFSYGRCKPFVLLRQVCDNGVSQGGVVDLGLKFLSGVCRGRFAPDGSLYVCGLNGWQTAAEADGCLQRVRYTGKPLDVPVKMAVDGNTIRLTFSNTLDAKSVAKAENYKAAWWNYRWSGEYGSKRWKVSDPNAEGQDEFAPRSVKLLDDGMTVELRFEKSQPVMQMQVGYNLLTTENRKVVGSVYLTINTTGK